MEISLAGTLISSLRTSLHRHVARPEVHRRAVQTGGLKPFSTSLSTDAPNSACSWCGDLSHFMYNLSNSLGFFKIIVLIMSHFSKWQAFSCFLIMPFPFMCIDWKSLQMKHWLTEVDGNKGGLLVWWNCPVVCGNLSKLSGSQWLSYSRAEKKSMKIFHWHMMMTLTSLLACSSKMAVLSPFMPNVSYRKIMNT